MKGNSFAQRIKDLRKARMLTQVELAKQLSVTQQTIALWEAGKSSPHGDSLKKVAMLFSVPLDDLLGLDKIDVSDLKERIEKLEQKVNSLAI